MAKPDSHKLAAIDPARRRFLARTAWSAGLLAVGGCVHAGINGATRTLARVDSVGAEAFLAAVRGGLQAADADGIRVPAGFRARVIARSGVPVMPGGYTWHPAPDGGACFATADGGWVYVSNSEVAATGGVGVLKFDPGGAIVDAYPILSGTSINCAGGPTPWNTWLSCEEHDLGLVWECDPFKPGQGVARPALGTFAHEACAVDPAGRHIYLTEDRRDASGLYRFTPTRYPDLTDGVLEIATLEGDPDAGRTRVTWKRVPNPNPRADDIPCRRQVAGSHPFQRGEGMAFHDGIVWFTTTDDHRVWAYRCRDQSIAIAYDADRRAADGLDAPLRNPDNVTVDSGGTVFVAEDGDDRQLVLFAPDGSALPMMQWVGHDQSEVTGPAFSPDGTRLYLSSQRGQGGRAEHGITIQISGPFPRRRG